MNKVKDEFLNLNHYMTKTIHLSIAIFMDIEFKRFNR